MNNDQFSEAALALNRQRKQARAVSSELAIIYNGCRYNVAAVPGVVRGDLLEFVVAMDAYAPGTINAILGDGTLLACPRIDSQAAEQVAG